jgi:hypothetical protein
MPIKNLNGGKTFPKRGRLGSGAYFPGNVNAPRIRGTVFGPNIAPLAQDTTVPRGDVPFGTRSNAGNGTSPFDSRLTVGDTAVHPNIGFRTISVQNKIEAQSPNSRGLVESPFGVNPVVQPHERHRLMHNKQTRTHKTAFGASHVLPSDTAFKRIHPTEKPRPPIRAQQNVVRVQQRTPVPSFSSRQNLWYDPNNSFQKGQVNSIAGGVGAGRWHTIKRGAAG